jgi:predicted amidohydrolase YtcJ
MKLKKNTLIVGMLGFLTVSCTPVEDESSRERADLILIGARIYTADLETPWANSVAIKDGRFVFVGDAEGASEFQSDSTRVVDVAGKLVLPGLIDAHAHPGYIDVELYGEIAATNEEELLAAVKEYAEAHPGDDWLRLCCWPLDLYVSGNQGPDKRVLDSVVADRPVWFVSGYWHSGWLNSKALETLGVDENTPDPKPGVATFVRDENGEATGWVKEGAGWQLFAEHFPLDDASHIEIHEQSVRAALQHMSELGITALYDAGNFGFEDQVYAFIAGLEKEGELPVRYEGTYQVFTPERRARAVSEMKRYRAKFGGERLQFNTVKLFMDGVYQNRSSALLDPYTDDSAYVGDTLLSVDELHDFLLELNAESFDLHIHVEGDLAVRRSLDAVEGAQGAAGDNWQMRVTLSHLGLIDEADLPRFKELGIIANYTPWWFTTDPDDSVRRSMGDERFESMFDPKSLLDLGVTVTLSSDEWWGGDLLPTYLNPYFGMQIASNRRYPSEWRDEDEQTKPPLDGGLSMVEIIAGYTQQAAYQLRMENEIGSIEKGKVANLIVLSDNLFDIDRDRIWQVKPVAVLMEGQVIQGALSRSAYNSHSAPPLPGN